MSRNRRSDWIIDNRSDVLLSRRGLMSALGVTGLASLMTGCVSGESGTTATTTQATGGPLEKTLRIYSWADYDAPGVLKSFAKATGTQITYDSYASNEEMIAKLVAAKGTSGYDIVVPSGTYVPQMVENGLLAPLNKDLIPNLSHVDPQFLSQSWDRDNNYTICKDWGTTGYVYDRTVVDRELRTWGDFLDAAQNEASGKTSMLDDPAELVGPYFWSRDLSWSTTDPAQLEAAEKYVVDNLAPHLASFDSKPGSGAIPTAQNALIQAYNGDARLGITTSKDPSRWQWVLPGPRTELWMDNWAIVAGAEHPEAAHAFINTVLDPKNALKELSYVGYNTGTVGIEDEARKLNLPRLDMVFYTPSQVATMETLKLTDAQQRLVDIWSKAKAAAGG